MSGIAGLADRADAAVADADVRLDDAPVIEDDRVGDDEVRRAVGARRLRLPLAVANDLAAAEDDLFAVAREVALDLEDQRRVAEADAITGGRAVEVGVRASRDLSPGSSDEPAAPRSLERRVALLVERAVDQPAHAVARAACRRAGSRSTSRPSPGSNRSAVPAGMSSRRPYARARSKRRNRFTSKKCVCDPTWIGRSPALSTRSRTAVAPGVQLDRSVARKYSPGIMLAVTGSDRER